ncbi:MAG: ETC complex I subunit [Pseudomonadota bacterium]
MTRQARIFQPAKTATQSGRANMRQWVLEVEPTEPSLPDDLMGWCGSNDTAKQVRMHFDSCEQAENYAKTNGYAYVISRPHVRKITPKSYAQNFAYDRHAPWTH